MEDAMLSSSYFRLYLKKGLLQGLAIVLTATVIGFSTNMIRKDGLPVVGKWSVEDRVADKSGASLVISLPEAKAVYHKNKALFLDARAQDMFDAGHIRGARNLPWYMVDDYFIEIVKGLDKNTRIITYCDGENCNLSHELALFLKELGFLNTSVLVNGWTVWQEARLPVAEGTGDSQANYYQKDSQGVVK